MNSLGELYQELILDHNARPRNFGVMQAPSHKAEGVNPLCGDHVVVYLKVVDNVIEAVQFDGKGCAISKASASLMTQNLRGKTVAEAEATFGQFHDMVMRDDDDDDDAAEGDDEACEEALGKLMALAGVRGFPMRVKCATLAWHTFHAAVGRRGEQVSTEAPETQTVPRVQGLLRREDAPTGAPQGPAPTEVRQQVTPNTKVGR